MSQQIQSDDYYSQSAQKAINAAMDDGLKNGRSPEEIRFNIRRAYPFSLPRHANSREYKIWSRLVHQAEEELGLEPRRHKRADADDLGNDESQTTERKPAVAPRPLTRKHQTPVYRSLRELQAIEPVDRQSAAYFLRNHCRTLVAMNVDHDALRIVLKDSDADESALKFEIRETLDLGDDTEYEAVFLRSARKMFKAFFELHKAKL